MDKLGRHILLISSSLVMSLSLTGLVVYFYLKDGLDSPVVSHIGWLPLTSLLLFTAAFSFGYGPVPWMIMGELFSSDVRSACGSIATVFNWSFAFLTTKTYGNLSSLLGIYGAFAVYTVITLTGIPFVALFLPETKGKSLEEITALFKTQTGSKSYSKITPPSQRRK